MEYIGQPYIVYAQIDGQGRITAINSSAFVGGDWGTEIDQGWGDKYHHAQNNYFPHPLYGEDGIPRYKLEDGQAVERTEEEIAADRAELPEATPALYDAFGLDESGYPVWSQPSGAHDAYNTGDIVNYNGTLYKSLLDGNTWSPEAYPQGWEVYSE